jgi:phosphoglycerol transferase MdoB-like AlkP superfamily enzyme
MLFSIRQKNKFANVPIILSRFAALNLVVLVVLIILRLSQYVSMSLTHTMPSGAVLLELRGCLQDMVLWLIFSWFLLIPFFLFSLIKRWIGTVFFGFVFYLVAATEWALFQYFKIQMTPLDQVIFSYSAREMMMIVQDSVQLNFLAFLPFILIGLLTTFFVIISEKIKASRILLALFFVVSLSAFFLRKPVAPKETGNGSRFEYYLAVNKCAYLVDQVNLYFSSLRQTATSATVEAAARRYQAAHPEFVFPGTRYPFLHNDLTPDVLSPFFNLGKEKPNLVFIVVESLSSCFCGDNNVFGSFTPFLDSIAGHSLYWSNFLATSDRTFNVLPALFGSLPPGDPTFVNTAARIPYHFSLIRYLHENGYYSSFFYAGEPKFNCMEDFLHRQDIDYILRNFGPNFANVNALTDGYHWGHCDGDLFSRSFEVIDSLKRSPRLDIYLTLSLHSPFIPPDQKYYMARVDNRLKKIDPGNPFKADIEHNKNIFATILYTDHALREFFNKYRKKTEFGNTIFIITGDHAMPELNPRRFSCIAAYHVPLIIYSPMLKKSVHMRSVSSHLDVTPTILAMMRQQYNISTRSLAPWMGSGIDTAAGPRNIHTLPFILNNKEIIEYVNQSDYLFQNTISRILPDLWLNNNPDTSILRKMNGERADFKILNTYVTKQNMLVPKEVYFDKDCDSAEIEIKKVKPLNPTDSTSEYRSLFRDLKISSKIKFLRLEITLDIRSPEPDSGKIPFVVFDLYRSNKQPCLWNAFDIPGNKKSSARPGEWRTLTINEFVEVGYLRGTEDYSLNMYVWNYKRSIVRFNNPRIRIIGYY